MSLGVDRICSILSAARHSKEAAAVLVPRSFARGMIDELFPLPEAEEEWGITLMDAANRRVRAEKERQRARYLKSVQRGGYVGTVFGYPMLVADDCVVCVFDRAELEEHATLHGVDLSELPQSDELTHSAQ